MNDWMLDQIARERIKDWVREAERARLIAAYNQPQKKNAGSPQPRAYVKRLRLLGRIFIFRVTTLPACGPFREQTQARSITQR